MAQKKFKDLSKITALENTDILAIERDDGTKQVSFGQLCDAITLQGIEEQSEEFPKINTDDTLKAMAGKINKWQEDALKKIEESPSGGDASVDILDTKEEIEANTAAGKVAGAQAVKEMFSEINSNIGGLSFYEDEAGNKYVVGADSVPKKLGDVELSSFGYTIGYSWTSIPLPTDDAKIVMVKTHYNNSGAFIDMAAKSVIFYSPNNLEVKYVGKSTISALSHHGTSITVYYV